MKKLKFEEYEVQLAIWDIAGQDKYDLTRKMFFEGCIGCLLVYDITRSLTFDRIQSKGLEDFSKFAIPDGIYVLIGNKIDLKNSEIILTEKGQEVAKQIEASDFIETRAKVDYNVDSACKKLVSQALCNFGVKIE